MSKNQIFFPRKIGGLALALVCLLPASALSQQRIGQASTVRNDVVRTSAGKSLGLTKGGSVFRNEAIRTGRRSFAKLVFLDQTNLSIGPVSRVVLDKFVYSGNRSTQAMTVNLARGTFRFTTGILDKRAYKIKTSVATIGVRGTILDIESLLGRTRITLRDQGAALVCTNGLRPKCHELRNRGDSVVVRSNSITPVRVSRLRYLFEDNCKNDPDLCTTTRFVQDTGVGPGPRAAPRPTPIPGKVFLGPLAGPLGATAVVGGFAGITIVLINNGSSKSVPDPVPVSP